MQKMKSGVANAVAGLWGAAEATLFFIVPDVFLSWLALSDRRQALVACLYAVLGALVGGTIMWAWGRNDPEAARATLDLVPAIADSTIARVQRQLDETGITALFLGPLSGIPYKIYAVEAAQAGIGLLVFLAVSVPARLMRFVAVAFVIGALGQVLQRRLSLRAVRIVLVACWVVFYAWFLAIMPG